MNVGYNMNNYYDKNAKDYITNTINCDMSHHYQKFIKYLPSNSKILDIGFGSGRDMIYFKSKGYIVEGIDTSIEFVNNMKSQGYNVKLESVEDMNYINKYDAIWACASLLHVKRENLEKTFINCLQALKENGILYCSFKYGNQEILAGERYFNYINEDIIYDLLKNNDFTVLDIYKSLDVRKERKTEEWINIIIRKI